MRRKPVTEGGEKTRVMDRVGCGAGKSRGWNSETKVMDNKKKMSFSTGICSTAQLDLL
jgi:hypothetical protein